MNEQKNKFTTYTFKQRKGMEGVGDCYYEYMSPEEIKKDRKEHEKYVQELKDSGEHGKEYLATITIQSDDTFDTPTEATTSYKMIIWDTEDMN